MVPPPLVVDSFTVTFPVGWVAGKVDEWTFYRKHFCKVKDGLKSVDVIAVSPDQTAYFIEFKNYRGQIRAKSVTLEAEFVDKTLGTLSIMLPARCSANVEAEKSLAIRVLNAGKIRLVLHLDQSRPGNLLFPPVADAANLTQRLRAKLRSIDPHVKICSSANMAGVPWSVS